MNNQIQEQTMSEVLVISARHAILQPKNSTSFT